LISLTETVSVFPLSVIVLVLLLYLTECLVFNSVCALEDIDKQSMLTNLCCCGNLFLELEGSPSAANVVVVGVVGVGVIRFLKFPKDLSIRNRS